MKFIPIVCLLLLTGISRSCSGAPAANSPDTPADGGDNEETVVPEPSGRGFVFGYVQPAPWNFEQCFPLVRWDCLTHVLPSFCYVLPDGSLDSEVLDLYIRDIRDEARRHGVKVIPSFRSTHGKAWFSEAISAPESRERLADNITRYVAKYGLDGVDIDFEEYDRLSANLGNLLDLFRRVRSKMDESLLMTCAMNPGKWLKYGKEWHTCFDYVNVMSYDKKSDTPGQTASFESYVSDMEYCHRELGIPYSKMLGGLPFYGFSWDKIPGTDSAGGVTFHNIMECYRDKVSDAKDRDNVGNTFYNGHKTIMRKCGYALEKGLGGVMIWQLFQDARLDRESLLVAVGEKMGKDGS